MKPGTQPLGRVNPRAGFNNYGFLWFSVISLALLEENLVLLVSVDRNVVRERKWKQEKKKKKDKKGWADGVRKGSRMGNGQKKRVQQEDFPGGHPLEYYYHPSTFNFRVLMGSGALVLV